MWNEEKHLKRGIIFALICLAAIFGLAINAWADDRSGDPNGDGSCNVGDAVYIITYVFKNGPPPVPIEYATTAQVDSLNRKIDDFIDVWGRWSISNNPGTPYDKYETGWWRLKP